MRHINKAVLVGSSILAVLGLSALVEAKATSQKIHESLHVIAQRQLNKDFRIVLTLEKNYNVCGSVGDAYVGHVEMHTYQHGYDEHTQKLTSKDIWVPIDKHYSILVDEVSIADATLFDDGGCME